MKCYNCGSEYIEQTGSLELPSKILGDFSVDNVQYFKCAQCEEIMLSDKTWRIADQEENRLIKEFLRDLPFKKFVGASKAANILGMSRQALHKHRRIRRGFIYSILHEGKIHYHIESVKLFKDTEDGRFPLKKQVPKKEKEYIIVSKPYPSERNRFHNISSIGKTVGWHPNQSPLTKSTGYSHG